MGRAAEFYGAHDVDALFNGHPLRPAPWDSARRSTKVQDYEPEKVRAVLMHPDRHEMVDFDPRELKKTQPNITRAGVSHYMSAENAPVYRDAHNAGNARPVVYRRGDEDMILSGHHRATTALLRGEQFKAVLVEGDWGPKRPGAR